MGTLEALSPDLRASSVRADPRRPRSPCVGSTSFRRILLMSWVRPLLAGSRGSIKVPLIRLSGRVWSEQHVGSVRGSSSNGPNLTHSCHMPSCMSRHAIGQNDAYPDLRVRLRREAYAGERATKEKRTRGQDMCLAEMEARANYQGKKPLQACMRSLYWSVIRPSITSRYSHDR